jgi:hypothetical protein
LSCLELFHELDLGLDLGLHLRLHPRLNRPCSAARQFLEPTLLASQDAAGLRIYAGGGRCAPCACVTSSCSDSQIYAHDVCGSCGGCMPKDRARGSCVEPYRTAQYSTAQYYDATTILYSTASSVLPHGIQMPHAHGQDQWAAPTTCRRCTSPAPRAFHSRPHSL